jgi:hypothetical protein
MGRTSVKNVVAAGECGLTTRRRRIHLVDPELVIDPGLALLPRPVRVFLRFNRVTELLRMRSASE